MLGPTKYFKRDLYTFIVSNTECIASKWISESGLRNNSKYVEISTGEFYYPVPIYRTGIQHLLLQKYWEF